MAYSIIPTHKPQHISQISWSSRQNIPFYPQLSLSSKSPLSQFPLQAKKTKKNTMLLKKVSEVPNLDQVHEISALPPPSSDLRPAPKFMVIGHRGNGMNSVTSSLIKENSILSFNEAGRFPIQFIEFDVQVTNDDRPVIFHDNFILSRDEESGTISEKRVTDLSLQQFLSTKPLLRRTHDGQIVDWTVENDDPLCTLEEAFLKVNPNLGFNIELKFDDDIVYTDEELVHSLRVVVLCVLEHSGNRPVIFSTFHPDAARLVRRLQSLYPVLFLTDGGTEIYSDVRRNSLEEAVGLCKEFGLQGIVSEVRAVLRKPWMISEAKEVGVGSLLMTYGELNNVGEVVYLQHLMGVDGVIVDRVREITAAVQDFLWQHETRCLSNCS